MSPREDSLSSLLNLDSGIPVQNPAVTTVPIVSLAKARQEAAEKAAEEKKRQRNLLTSSLSIGLILTSCTSIFALSQAQQTQRLRVEQLAANAHFLDWQPTCKRRN